MRGCIRDKAKELGFDAVAIASAIEPLVDDFARYEAFVDAGMHGPMTYLARNRNVRRTVRSADILDGAQSVICVAQRYAVEGAGNDSVAGRIARYARGRDYHHHLRASLRKLAEFVRTLEPGAQARAVCDTAPVLERAWAARSGLGFIGKNSMLIIPGLGSYVLLGEVITTLALPPDRRQPQRCGACESCLRACPTQALVRPFMLDARRCISCLTIEQRGAIDVTLELAIGDCIFGCDACQQNCPFNASSRATIPAGSPYDSLPQWTQSSLQSMLEAGPETLAAMLVGSALQRQGEVGIRRNLVIAAGNSGDARLREVLVRIKDALEPEWLREVACRAIARL
jgi:epoxyqueuosine reductase